MSWIEAVVWIMITSHAGFFSLQATNREERWSVGTTVFTAFLHCSSQSRGPIHQCCPSELSLWQTSLQITFLCTNIPTIWLWHRISALRRKHFAEVPKGEAGRKKNPPLSCTTSVAEGHLQSTWEVSPRCQKNHKQLTVQTGAASEFFQYHRIWGYNSSRGRHRVFCTNIHSNIRRSQDGGWKGWGWDSHTETDTRRKETGNESTSFWGWRGTEEGSCL